MEDIKMKIVEQVFTPTDHISHPTFTGLKFESECGRVKFESDVPGMIIAEPEHLLIELIEMYPSWKMK